MSHKRCELGHAIIRHFSCLFSSEISQSMGQYPKTVKDWNDLPASLITSAEMSDDSVIVCLSLLLLCELGINLPCCAILSLAHLSPRLIGELIGYTWSGVRPSSSYVVVHNFKDLLL